MEWVEITSKTVEEAKEAALDQLGVDTDDAEFEILEEPSRGLFGKTRGQARVRARIRPTRPRPKVERRDRRKRTGTKEGGKGRSGSASSSPTDESDDSGADVSTKPAPAKKQGERKRAAAPKAKNAETGTNEKKSDTQGAEPMTDTDVDIVAHTAIVSEFLTGLVEAFGVSGQVESESIDEDTVEIRIDGQDLGILVGPKGNTLAAIQELSRTVVHRKVPGQAAGRIRLDVAGYRQRRREALERFTQNVAEDVRSAGVQKALEPMNAADRKVVHDTVNEMDGVSTLSEGDEPRRRVVIIPA
ncbi:Jag Predicted RNA-binding protein [Acidimicrobiia bacterium]